MSYQAYSEDRYLGDFATIQGLEDFRQWIERLDPEKIPELRHLVEHGWTEKPKALKKECTLAPGSEDSAVAEILDNLRKVIDPKAHVLLISDGVGQVETRRRPRKHLEKEIDP